MGYPYDIQGVRSMGSAPQDIGWTNAESVPGPVVLIEDTELLRFRSSRGNGHSRMPKSLIPFKL